jgi:DNA-directed RNA polymerase subunit L
MSNNKFVIESDVPNDRVDIYAMPNVRIRILQSENKDEFIIEIEGDSVDNSIVNAIRRIIMMCIPIYAFHRSNVVIEIKKSRHMYNNDLIYNQLETLPIYDVPNYFDLEDPETFMPTDVLKKLFSNFIQEKYTEEKTEENVINENKKLFKIELSINYKNNTGSDKFVSTHDATLKIDGKVANSYMIRDPICIMVLKPSEEISLRAEANLGISKMHASYEATTNTIHEEITPTKYRLWYETLGQLDKKIIFIKACIILIKKLGYLKKFIENTFTEERDVSEKMEIELYGEDHTLGNLLATILQKCDYVEKAGYKMPHPFMDQIVVAYKLKPKSKIGPIKVLVDCIDYLIKVFQTILTSTEKSK